MSLSRILHKPRGAHSFVGDSRWVLPSCMMGWEFEYEGVTDRILPHHTFSGFWTYHEEGSLRDNGAEFVFTNPIFGVDACNALDWLVDHARDNKWKCSKRTGIHVHLDVRDLEAPQLVGLSILYAALEPILYRWVGDGRENSHFCLPLYKADRALLQTTEILASVLADHKSDGHSAIQAADNFQRYAGFNLQALSKFGSIEFRHLQTTHNRTRIQDWGNIILSLKAAAFKLPQSDGAVVHMIQRMGAWELLNYVFTPSLAAVLFTSDSQALLTNYGLPSARDIAVHSCGTEVWIKQTYPKGTYKGYQIWAKNRVGAKEFEVPTVKIVDGPVPQPVAAIEDELDPVEDAPQRNHRFLIQPDLLLNDWAVPPPGVQRAMELIEEQAPQPVARNLLAPRRPLQPGRRQR